MTALPTCGKAGAVPCSKLGIQMQQRQPSSLGARVRALEQIPKLRTGQDRQPRFRAELFQQAQVIGVIGYVLDEQKGKRYHLVKTLLELF